MIGRNSILKIRKILPENSLPLLQILPPLPRKKELISLVMTLMTMFSLNQNSVV